MPALIFDTETTGMFVRNARPDNPSIAKLVQLGAVLLDDAGVEVSSLNLIIYPERWEVPEGAAAIHGISTNRAKRYGVALENACHAFSDLLDIADVLVAHNETYDDQIMQHAFWMSNLDPIKVAGKRKFCTMQSSTAIVKAPKKVGSGYKWPTLTECTRFFFDEALDGAHDAMVDVRATARIYTHLTKERVH